MGKIMDYATAKKLKEVGFPQDIKAGDKFYRFIGHPRMGIPHQQAVNTAFVAQTKEMLNEDYVKIPILSELIDACGMPFRLKTITTSRLDEWVASNSGAKVHFQGGAGKSPEIAVSNLYLALNKSHV